MRSSFARLVTVLCLALGGLAVMPSPATALSQDPDPSTWMANGKIFASVRYGDVMFIGGTFKKLRESIAPGPNTGPQVTGLTGLAAIDLTTGEGIPSFKPQITVSGNQTLEVQSLAIVDDTLYVGGQFSAVDGQTRWNIAAIDINPNTMTGTVDPGFDPVVGVPTGNLANFEVLKILPGPDALYIGGAFSKVDGKGRIKMAKLSYNGVLDNTFKPGSTNGAVRDLEWAADGQTIFASGNFYTLSGAARLAVGRINPTTGAATNWAVPPGQIPASGSPARQICWDIIATSTRLFAGCGKGPNFIGAFRVDTGDTGSRTWQFGTGGNVVSLRLLAGGDAIAFGGHFGINTIPGRYNGLMPVCGSIGSTRYLRAFGILRNINQTSTSSVVRDGNTSATTAYLDCSFTPNFEGEDPDGPNFVGTNKFGGVWEIQVTGQHLWALGEFKYVNANVRRAIARFPL
jgi:hypothetical protein